MGRGDLKWEMYMSVCVSVLGREGWRRVGIGIGIGGGEGLAGAVEEEFLFL